MSKTTDQEQDLLKYLPLVERAARNVKVKSTEYEREDLVNIGFIGLMDAFKKYDASKNVPFENYAYIRIKGSIIDEVRKNAKVPRSQMDRLNNYYKAKEALEQKLHRQPTEKEVCKHLGITEKQLKAMHQTVHALSNTSLDEVLFNEDSEGTSRIDFIEDDQTAGSLEQLLQKEQKEFLHQAIKQLSKREQTILQLYYDEELPLKEIAYIYDISVPRVSQIHGATLIKLKDHIKKAMQEDDE